MTGIKASKKHIAVFLFPFWGVFLAVIAIVLLTYLFYMDTQGIQNQCVPYWRSSYV